MIGKAIYTLITDVTDGVGATIGTRCYPMTAPQGAEYPLVTYEPSSPQPSDNKEGPSQLDTQNVEVVIYTRKFSEGEDIASQLRAMFDRFGGMVSTVPIQSVQFENQSYEHYPEIDLFAIVQVFKFRIVRDASVVVTGLPLEQLTLNRLDDVDTTGATDDQVLTYDAATDSWGPEDASTVAGLDDLTDVTIDTPANNQALVYNSAAGEWRNDQLSLTQLEGISSELGDAIDRQALVYDEASNQWIADGVGQVVIPVRNPSRDDSIAVGTVLKATGSQGDRILVAPFQPTDDPKLLVGIASEAIGTGADGHAQVYGELRQIDTDAYNLGDILYPQADGVLGTTENLFPFAIVTRKHQNTGRIFVRMWVPGKGYHNRYRTEASAEMFVGVGAEVELYYTATADGDGFVTQDLTATPAGGNVEERVLRYKSGAFGDSGTTTGYTDAGLATDATYAEMLTAFNNLIKTESPPLTVYATRTEVADRSGLLADYPGAAAAYSLRLLDTDYTGDAIRVRRASDNAEQNIGFSEGDLDTSALATFCAGTNGFVKVWYDQSGNGNDATQTTTSRQPKVYDSSTGVVLENGKTANLFDGVTGGQGLFGTTISATAGAFSAFAVRNRTKVALADNYLFDSYIAPDRINFDTLGNALSIGGQNFNPLFGGTGQTLVSVFSSSAGTSGYTDGVDKNLSGGTHIDQRIGQFSIGNFVLAASQTGFGGNIQEIIIYPSDQSTNRTGIETNINDNYLIYGQSPTGLLADYPGAAAAYSLRQLISTAQLAIAVRRDSDDAVLGIGFVNGELDTTTLASFCSGTDGYVSVWFDQSGNGNHATQTTTASQPKVYDSVTGVVTENGKAAVQFNGTSSRMTSPMIVASDFTTSVVLAASTAVQGNNWLLQDTSGADVLLQHVDTNFRFYDGTTYVIGTAATDQHHIFISANSSGSVVSYDGANQGISGIANNGYTDLEIGADSGSRWWHGKFQEIVIWGQYQSTNRTGIETNINDHYSIYTP